MSAKDSVVYVVDDDPSVGKAIERLIRSAGHEARVFTSPLDFLDCLGPDAPACLILDVDMPALNGLELQEFLAHEAIPLPIVFISGHGTVPISVKAMKAGAVDFLSKPFNDTELLDAVSHAIETDRRARQDHEHVARLKECAKTLTPRERQVFRLVVQGLLNKQIAFELGTAEKTVKVHRARVMAKMRAQSIADLVRFADRLGIDSRSA
ncbi:MAG: response regulator transcription factor [Syntrophobacteraceae bacterium]